MEGLLRSCPQPWCWIERWRVVTYLGTRGGCCITIFSPWSWTVLRAKEESLPFCPLFISALLLLSLPAMFIFAFSVSYLMPLFWSFFSLPLLSLYLTALTCSSLCFTRSGECSCRHQAGERLKNKKRKVRESFRPCSWPPYVQRNAYRREAFKCTRHLGLL